jgi:RNA polymerase sigma-70 factor (ECF subfamily)
MTTIPLSAPELRPRTRYARVAPDRSRRPAKRPAIESRRARDERLFADLFLEHYSSLCEFVDSYVHAPDVAEEIVQTVFLRLWEARETWQPSQGARAYLFAACRNQALDLLRHERIVTRTAAFAVDCEAVRAGIPPRADAELEAAELAERLRSVVAQLPERRRLVVVLRWQYQLSNPEIAEIMGISVKGVEVQFSRALADLRRELGPRTLDIV